MRNFHDWTPPRTPPATGCCDADARADGLAGGRSIEVADAIVLHEGSGVTGRHGGFTIHPVHRNRPWLSRKNTPATLLAVSAPLNLVLTIYLFARSCGSTPGRHGSSCAVCRKFLRRIIRWRKKFRKNKSLAHVLRPRVADLVNRRRCGAK